MTDHLEDWIAETAESITARLEGAKEAQRQTRFTLAMMAVVSMMMLILTYNAYLSFDSQWVLELERARGVPNALASADDAKTVPDILTHTALHDWAESRSAEIALLGIRVSVDDAPILGTVSLFLFSLWLILVTRRENNTVGSLLRDTDTPRGRSEFNEQVLYAKGQRWRIFHTLVANNLFVTFDRSMSRIDSLGGGNPLMSESPRDVKGLPRRLALSFAREFFFWFPVVAAAFTFYLGRRSYFQPDPFVPGMEIPGAGAPLFYESMIVFLACWIPLLVCCKGAAQYSKATDCVLRDYGEKLQSDLLRRESQVRRVSEDVSAHDERFAR